MNGTDPLPTNAVLACVVLVGIVMPVLLGIVAIAVVVALS